jgi:transcriptional regulator with XRE-family HTH domain
VAVEVQALLDEQGISGAELARRTGVSQDYVATRLRCEADFTLTFVEKVASALGTDPIALLRGAASRVTQEELDAAAMGFAKGTRLERAQVLVVCPLCDYVTSVMGGGLAAHTKSVHGVTMLAVLGGVCPLCGRDSGLDGALTHARDVHGIESLVRLWAVTINDGDRHGVVAARLERIPHTATEPGL